MGNKGGRSRDVYSYALRPSAEGHMMSTVTLLGLAAKAHGPAPPSLRHLYRYFDLYRAPHIHPPTAGSTPEKLWQTATVGAIGLPCTTGEAWDVTGSTKTTKGCSVYALRANDGPDEL